MPKDPEFSPHKSASRTSGDPEFVHLHVHTDYSMLDGAARIDDLVKEVANQGQQAVAITDHGYLFGAFEFWQKANSAGVKPIIGIEAYLTPGTSRFDQSRVFFGPTLPDGRAINKDDDVSAGGSYTHLTMWARNNTGMHNLFRAGSLASLEGQWGKWPRMDRELLNRYSEGLIATTGCPSGEVQTHLRLGQYDEALRSAGEFQDIFGKDSFYVELMDHNLDIEKRVTQDLLKLAKDINAPLVATNDLHYVKQQDADSQEALLALNSGSNLNDPTRFKFDGTGYYVKSAAEMAKVFPEHPEALANTLLIAEQCEVTFDTKANYMPHFPVPAGEDEVSFFIKEIERGLTRRYPAGIPDDVRAQAKYETDVIVQMGFPGYFLIVADFIGWARAQGIRVGPGRGSAAGSMVAYAMGITELDPLQHGLIFERFLNPERVSMPDVDVDFDDRRREEVMRYVTQKYGADRVAQVVTYGTIKAKNALKDSARLLGLPYSMGEKLTKAMPNPVQGHDMSLKQVFDPNNERYSEAAELREIIATDPEAGRVNELAQSIEGLKRQWGVHACAVIMSSVPLTDVIPVMKRPQDGAIITQFDYPTCESLGLIKMDFLGLKNLTIIDDALENIVNNGKPAVVIEKALLDDKPTYELLARGDTLGVFQLDGTAMRNLLRAMKPDNFEDISAVIALYRPGPMGMDSHNNYAKRKNGLQENIPIHPELEKPLAEVLDGTYGLIVYQEQVQRAAQVLAGYSLGQADLLRRAMGKKKPEILAKEFVPFQAGARERGYSDEAIQAVWDTLVPFAGYAFNKAHSAGYGVVSYWTAYLKANYPSEYMAALLQSTRDDKDKLALYLNECRRMGITVLPPDVNTSASKFTAVGDDIRFGLGGIRNVGEGVVDAIIDARAAKGEFTSFVDFLDKVPAVVCNRRTIESLIKAGAFDSLGESRRAIHLIHQPAIDEVIEVKRQESEGIFDLFSGFDATAPTSGVTIKVPDLPDWDKATRLAFEREMLGLYVSDHPLSGLEPVLTAASDVTIAALMNDTGDEEGHFDRPDNSQVKIAGLITSLQVRMSKSGNQYAIVQLEDITGSIEISFFGEAYLKYGPSLKPDAIISVSGRIQRRDEVASLRAQEMSIPDISALESAPISLTLPSNRITQQTLERLKNVLNNHQGISPVRLVVIENGKRITVQAADNYRVNKTPELYSDVKAVLGINCLNATLAQ